MASYVGGWTDDAPDVRQLVKQLKAEGIDAKATDTSPYQGHLELKIEAQDLKKAKKWLKENGEEYIAGALELKGADMNQFLRVVLWTVVVATNGVSGIVLMTPLVGWCYGVELPVEDAEPSVQAIFSLGWPSLISVLILEYRNAEKMLKKS